MPEAGRATVKFVGDYSALMAGLTSTLAPGSLKSAGLKAGGALAAGFVASKVVSELSKAVDVTKQFDKELSSLKAVSGSTGKQLEAMRKQAIRMGADTVFSATEAAKAQTELAKGGLSASQILGGALKSSLDLAAAGELDLADAAETTVNAMQLFGLQGRDSARIADMLATAANRTTADVLDFAMALKQGGSVAKTAGYSMNDTVVILEALAEAGIKNSDAGTSMKASLIQLLNPTKKQADLAAQLGVSWLKQNGELKNGIQISRVLRRVTDDMTKAERTKTFAVLAGTDGFRTLSALYDAGASKLRNYARANEESGTAAETARTKTDNLAGDVEELSGAYETLQIQVGTLLTPAMRELTQAGTEAIRWVSNLNTELNKTPIGDSSWFDIMGDSFEAMKATVQLPFDPDGGIKRWMKLFSGDSEEVTRLRATSLARIDAAGSLRRAMRITSDARHQAGVASRRQQDAERDLRNARKRFGDGSSEVLRAEIRLARAKQRTIRLTKAARRAERLEGVERQVTAARTRDQVVQEKVRIGTLNRQIRVLGRKREVEIANNGRTKEARQLEAQIIRKIEARNNTQKRLNGVLGEAARLVGPQYARSLQKINVRQATLEKVLGRLPAKAGSVRGALGQLPPVFVKVGNTSNTQIGRTVEKMQGLQSASGLLRRVYGQNVGSRMPAATQSGMGKINESLQESLDAIQNTGTPQSRRRGGLIERVRQAFRDGGVPVALSSGEMFKTPDGKTGVVPGRPTAADNVLTSMPVGTKIFTFDGQRRLMEGASESEALRSQLPHFAQGGIVKPEIVGGTKKGAEVANTAVGKVHSAATAKLKKEREEAAAASVSGSGINGLVPQVKRALAFAAAHGWHGSVSSGFRTYAEQVALYQAYLNGTGNLAAKPGTSNHEGGQAVDVTDYGAFGAAMDQMGAGRLYSRISVEPWHYSVTGYKHGGLIAALQALYTGGQVRVVKNVGQYLLNKGFDFRATAGILGNAYREALPPWNPASVGTGGGGLWGFTTSPVSLADLKNYASSRGKPWTDELLQAQFMLIHGGMGLKGKLNAADKISDTARIFMEDWERPGVPALSDRVKGGYEASKILRDAGIVKPGSEERSGPSPQEQRKRESAARRKKREKSIRDLVAKAQNASGRRKKSLLWQVLQNYAAWGVFDAPMSKIVQGMVGVPGEQDHFLQRAREIAGIANPQAGGGQLTQLTKWLGRNVEVGGFEKKNSGLVSQLERMRDKGGDAAKDRRKRVHKRLARFGESFWFSGRLRKKDDRIAWLAETIENAEAWGSVASGPGGSELTDSEITEQIGLNRQLLGTQRGKKGVLDQAIPYATHLISMYEQSIATALKDPKQKWKVPGYRRGLNAARTVLGSGDGDGLLGNLRSLVGLTGEGGEILQTRLKLEELGATTSVEGAAVSERDSEIIALLREQLQLSQRENMVLDAQLPVFRQFMPKFHSGGDVPGHGDVMALLEGRETVYTADQNSRIHGALSAAPNVNVDVYVNGVKADDSQVEMVVRQELGSQIGRGRRAGSNRRMVLPR